MKGFSASKAAALLLVGMALSLLSTAQARTQTATSYSVSDAGFENVALVADAVVWSPGTVALSVGQCCGVGFGFADLALAFEAAAGAKIIGYEVRVDGEFLSDGYAQDWGLIEELGGIGLQRSFGPPDAGTWTLSSLLGADPFPALSFVVQANATPSFCPDPSDPGCGQGTEIDPLVQLKINTVTITPHIQAVPEPTSVALLVAGLAALAWTRRRSAPRR
jgi:hypothetical protein